MKLLFSTLFFAFSLAISSAQVSMSSPANKWVLGGGIGMGFADGFGLQFNPQAGYRFTNDLTGGISVDYWYQHNNSMDYTTNALGIGPYLQYNIQQTFYLKAQYEFYSMSSKYNGMNAVSNSENAIWLGGGYIQRITNNAYFMVGVMYNVLYNKDTSMLGSGFMPTAGVCFGF